MKNIATVLTLIVSIASSANAKATPEQKCQVARYKAAGKLEVCRQTAARNRVLTADSARYELDIRRCDIDFAKAWQKATDKAAAALASCPGHYPMEQYRAIIATHTAEIADALGGGMLEACRDDHLACESSYQSCGNAAYACSLDLNACQSDLAACNVDRDQSESTLANCSGDVSVCQNQPIAQVLKTGATICTDPWVPGTIQGAIPPSTGERDIPCAGTGQDGETQSGARHRYSDNGDGTVTDEATGLMWQKAGFRSSFSGSSWDDALRSIRVLNGNNSSCVAAAAPLSCCTGAGTGACTPFAGYSNWRLPNISELFSLADRGRYGAAKAIDPIFDQAYIFEPDYWSSTTDLFRPERAYSLYLSSIYMEGRPKEHGKDVRAVRGGQ